MKSELIKEIWKPVVEHEEYTISENGVIISKKIKRPLKQWVIKGYRYVKLDGKTYSVHRLVWKTFKGEIPEGMEINHIDENTENNCLSNLEVVSHKDNVNWATGNKRRSETLKHKKGEKILQLTQEGIFINSFPSMMEAERKTGIRHSHISEVCNGKYETAGGYMWKKLSIFSVYPLLS